MLFSFDSTTHAHECMIIYARVRRTRSLIANWVYFVMVSWWFYDNIHKYAYLRISLPHCFKLLITIRYFNVIFQTLVKNTQQRFARAPLGVGLGGADRSRLKNNKKWFFIITASAIWAGLDTRFRYKIYSTKNISYVLVRLNLIWLLTI